MSWFWVLLFGTALLYMRFLVQEMEGETKRLADERERAESGFVKTQKEIERFQSDFQAQIDGALNDFMRAFRSKDVYPYR